MRFSYSSDLGACRNAPPQSVARYLTLLVLGDCLADRRRIARLSQVLHHAPVSVDAVLLIGLLGPPCVGSRVGDPSREGDASATMAAVENISPRVFYVPGVHDPPVADFEQLDWEYVGSNSFDRDSSVLTGESEIASFPRLTAHSMNVLAQSVRLCDDLVVTSSASRSSDSATINPPAWCHSLSQRLRRPPASTQADPEAYIILGPREELQSPPKNAIVCVTCGEQNESTCSDPCFVDVGSFGLGGHFTLVHLERTDCGSGRNEDPIVDGAPLWKVRRIDKTSLSEVHANSIPALPARASSS